MGFVQRVGMSRNVVQTRETTSMSQTPAIEETSGKPQKYSIRSKRYSDKGWVDEQTGSYIPYEVKKTSSGYEIIERGTYTSYAASRTRDERVYIKKRLLLDKDGVVVREEKYSLSREGDKQSPRLDRLVDYDKKVYSNQRLERAQEKYAMTKKAEAVVRAKKAEGYMSPTEVAKEQARIKMENRVSRTQWRRENLREALKYDAIVAKDSVSSGSRAVLLPDMNDILYPSKPVTPFTGKFVPEPYRKDYAARVAGEQGKKPNIQTRIASSTKKVSFAYKLYDESPISTFRLREKDYSKIRGGLMSGASYLDAKGGHGRIIVRRDLRTRKIVSYQPGGGLPLKSVVDFALPPTHLQLQAEMALGYGISKVAIKSATLAVKSIKKLGGKLPKVKFNVVSNQADDILITIPKMDKTGVIRGAKRSRQIRMSKVARSKATRQQAYNPNIGFDIQKQESLVRLRSPGLKESFVKERVVRLKPSGDVVYKDLGLRTDVAALKGTGTPSKRIKKISSFQAYKPSKKRVDVLSTIVDKNTGQVQIVVQTQKYAQPQLISIKRSPKYKLESLNIKRPISVKADAQIGISQNSIGGIVQVQKKSYGGFRAGQKEKLFAKARAKQRARYFNELPKYSRGSAQLDWPVSRTKNVNWYNVEQDYSAIPSWDWASKSASQNILGRGVQTRSSVGLGVQDISKMALGSAERSGTLLKFDITSVLGTRVSVGLGSGSMQAQAQAQAQMQSQAQALAQIQKQSQISKQIVANTNALKLNQKFAINNKMFTYKKPKLYKPPKFKPYEFKAPKIRHTPIIKPKSIIPRIPIKWPTPGKYKFKLPKDDNKARKSSKRNTGLFEKYYDFGGLKL